MLVSSTPLRSFATAPALVASRCCRSLSQACVTVTARRARAPLSKRARPPKLGAVLPVEDPGGAALRAWLAQWPHDDCGVYLSRSADQGCVACAPRS